MKTIYLIISFVLVTILFGFHQTNHLRDNDPGKFEVFNDGFPRILLFRSGVISRWAQEGKLDHHLGMFDADTRKYAGEEGPPQKDWARIMAGFKKRHPGKLSLIHLNGESRTITNPEARKYFPGHWIYYPGELLKTDLEPGDTLIPVDYDEVFSRRSFRMRRGDGSVSMFPLLLIVALDEQGNKLWYESEYAQIKDIDAEHNTLIVDRGQYFSTARSYRSRQAYLAPMHCEYWGGIMCTLNTSDACPRDSNGETAADICLREIIEWCGPGGIAEHVDGIGFDVIYFQSKYPGLDINNDGLTEEGIGPDGRNFQTKGVYTFLKSLRAAMGPDFLLTSDSWDSKEQRAVGVFNGMESEGLCMPNDGWRKYAQTLNTQTYWNIHNNTRYQYSYITSKLNHPDDREISDQLYRMSLGTACVLGVSYTAAGNPVRLDGLPMIPEMHRGAADEPNWLGQPSGPMVILPKSAPDILNGSAAPFSSELVSRLKTKNCSVSLESDGTLLIKGTGVDPYQDMEVTLRGLDVPGGDLVIFCEAIAIDPLAGYDMNDRIPRQIILHANGLPDYPDQIGNRNFYNDIMAYMGTAGWTPCCGYFRRAGEGDGTIGLTFVIENQGSCRLRNLTAHNAPMALLREFEHGVVLVNPSRETVSFDLRASLPRFKTNRLWRIKADPTAYQPGPSTQSVLRHNDGRQENPGHIEVPPLDALFLAKQPQ